jgi:hypothetical protein
MHKSKYQDTFFQVTQRVAGSIALSSRTAIFPMIDVQITLIVFIIYVLFKVKLYKNYIYCLFIAFLKGM